MKITAFSISRYRSIIEAEKISMAEMTTLLGRNNEGKSNILKALNVAIEAVRHRALNTGARIVRSSPTGPRRRTTYGYDWFVDFPVQLQGGKGNQRTRFRLDFALTDEENAEFVALTGSGNNGVLPIQVELDSNATAEITFLKQGRGFAKYQEKAQQICDFVSRHIDFIYVPAIRTDRDAIEVVQTRVRRLLDSLEDDPAYKNAIAEVQAIQKPFLDQLAVDLEHQLKRFLPSIKSVAIDTSEQRLLKSVGSQLDMVIDDGVPTSLDAKGDGVKSLVALSLFNTTKRSGRSRIIAIEEPESHLHPGAVHELRRVLTDLAQDGQVIISTHSAAFVDRQRLANVVLVEGGKADRVKGVADVRTALGILISDNLLNAEFTVVCEGTTDARSLQLILSALSPKIRSAIQNGALVFDPLHGSSKLAFKLASLNRDVFSSYSLLDFDVAGKTAVADAVAKGILSTADYTLLKVRGNDEAELEDLILGSAIKEPLQQKFGVNLDLPAFKGKLKFSDRMRTGFEASGKLWTPTLEHEIKLVVAGEIEKKPLERLSASGRALLETVVRSIEGKLRAP